MASPRAADAHVPPVTTPRGLAHAKLLAIRFVAGLSAVRGERREALAARLREVDGGGALDAARARVRAAAVDPAVVGPSESTARFVAALDLLVQDAAAGDDRVAGRAADVVRALLVHAHPAHRPAFAALYAPFEPAVGFDRLLLG